MVDFSTEGHGRAPGLRPATGESADLLWSIAAWGSASFLSPPGLHASVALRVFLARRSEAWTLLSPPGGGLAASSGAVLAAIGSLAASFLPVSLEVGRRRLSWA